MTKGSVLALECVTDALVHHTGPFQNIENAVFTDWEEISECLDSLIWNVKLERDKKSTAPDKTGDVKGAE